MKKQDLFLYLYNKYKNLNIMARIAGVQFEKDYKGKPKKVIFDLKIWGQYLEDLFDGMEAEEVKDEETISLDELRKEIKRVRHINV